MDPIAQPIVVTLDRPRQIKWTTRAEARNSSLPRPVKFEALSKGDRRLYAVCAILWAALVDRDHEFDSPEDLAEFLGSGQQQVAALEAIRSMVKQTFPEKKSPSSSEQSTTGHSPSSTSASAPP